MSWLLLGAALVIIAGLFAAAARLVEERDEWMAYAWRLQDELDERAGAGGRP